MCSSVTVQIVDFRGNVANKMVFSKNNVQSNKHFWSIVGMSMIHMYDKKKEGEIIIENLAVVSIPFHCIIFIIFFTNL